MTDSEQSNMQLAHLVTSDGATLVATVEVPAFPNNPPLLKLGARYFGGGMIGYGVAYLTYTEVAPPYEGFI